MTCMLQQTKESERNKSSCRGCQGGITESDGKKTTDAEEKGINDESGDSIHN